MENGTTAKRIVEMPRDTVKSVLTEMGFDKIKYSNQYIREDISVFPSRSGTGTEILYMGPEGYVEDFVWCLGSVELGCMEMKGF